FETGEAQAKLPSPLLRHGPGEKPCCRHVAVPITAGIGPWSGMTPEPPRASLPATKEFTRENNNKKRCLAGMHRRRTCLDECRTCGRCGLCEGRVPRRMCGTEWRCCGAKAGRSG